MEATGLTSNAHNDLEDFLVKLLDRELPPTLGDISEANRNMIHFELLAFAKDICLGKNSNTFKVYESLEGESKSFSKSSFLDTHGPWIGKFLTEALKLMGH